MLYVVCADLSVIYMQSYLLVTLILLKMEQVKLPFRADIVGSFLRPERLKKTRKEFEKGRLSPASLEQIENEEIARLIAEQKAIGLQVVTDGEFRRSWWHLDFFWGLGGIEKKQVSQGYLFHDLETRGESVKVTGKITGSHHPMTGHFRFVQNLAGQQAVAKQTIPAPAQLLAELIREGNMDDTLKVYGRMDGLLEDIAQAYRDVIGEFAAEGCRYLQLDDCTWGMLCDPEFRKNPQVNASEMALLFARVNEMSLNSRPEGMTITMHVCRGNYHSTWASRGGYEPIAEILFDLPVNAFFLEFDDERSGGFEPLRFIRNQTVVLGLITTKNATLEDKREVKARILEATKYIPLERLCLSPQCGFASTEEGNKLTEVQQWNKIRLMLKIAHSVWKNK